MSRPHTALLGRALHRLGAPGGRGSCAGQRRNAGPPSERGWRPAMTTGA